jgi:hypothetical protein
MGDDGNSGGWDGLGDIAGSIDTSGASLGGGGFGSDLGDLSGSFGGMDLSGGSGFSLDGLMNNLDLSNATLGYDDPASFSISPNAADDLGTIDLNSDNSFWGRLNQFAQSKLGTGLRGLASRSNPTFGMVNSMFNLANATQNTPSQAGKGFGSLAGSIGLGSLFGPVGALAGGALGGQLGQSMLGGLNQGYSGPSMGNQPGQEGGIGLGTGGLLGLAALYQGSRNAREIGGQMNSLQSLYGANSPFAQQAMQAIQRQGAKGGRRTSGNRADAAGLTQNQVQLQSLLAQNAARLAPTLAQMQQFRQGNRGQTLANLAGLYQKMGGMPGIQSGLDGLYSSVNGALNGFEAYDPSGYGIGSGTENYNDVLTDVWG